MKSSSIKKKVTTKSSQIPPLMSGGKQQPPSRNKKDTVKIADKLLNSERIAESGPGLSDPHSNLGVNNNLSKTMRNADALGGTELNISVASPNASSTKKVNKLTQSSKLANTGGKTPVSAKVPLPGASRVSVPSTSGLTLTGVRKSAAKAGNPSRNSGQTPQLSSTKGTKKSLASGHIKTNSQT